MTDNRDEKTRKFESARGPRGSTSSPRPEPVEGREDSESAPAAERDDLRSAFASGGGAPRAVSQAGQEGRAGVFLATAHPAKFAEIVEPIIGRVLDKPAPLVAALAHPRPIIRMPATLDALRERLSTDAW